MCIIFLLLFNYALLRLGLSIKTSPKTLCMQGVLKLNNKHLGLTSETFYGKVWVIPQHFILA